MSQDISKILAAWPYDPDRVAVRICRGEDGRERIQLRLDLGILEMEMDGRPDGQKVEGCESWLDFYEQLLERHKSIHDSPPFVLESEDCQKLMREGVQYYHRYLSFWHLDMYEECARDTQRNLRLFSFVRRYGRNERDQLQFDQWRPYVTMMNARALAMPHLEQGDYAAAIKAVDAGIDGIHQFLGDYDEMQRADTVGELNFLIRWRKEIQERKLSPEAVACGDRTVVQLQQKLAEAIASERYEDAARMRDELNRLTQAPAASHQPPPPPAISGQM